MAYAEPGNYGGVALAPGARRGGQPAATWSVPVMTLDGLGVERCRLLKIDVEGMELDVLEGGRALIAAARPIVYVENNDAAKSPALISWLLARDYHLFWHVSRFFNPRNFFANAVNVFGNLGRPQHDRRRRRARAGLRAFSPCDRRQRQLGGLAAAAGRTVMKGA